MYRPFSQFGSKKETLFGQKNEDLSELSTVWSAWDALTITSKREVYGWHLQFEVLPSSRLSFFLSLYTLCVEMSILFWNTMKSQDTVESQLENSNSCKQTEGV